MQVPPYEQPYGIWTPDSQPIRKNKNRSDLENLFQSAAFFHVRRTFPKRPGIKVYVRLRSDTVRPANRADDEPTNCSV